MATSNEFFFIGNPIPAYKPFGASDKPFSWSAFTRWLGEEIDCEPEFVNLIESDECELVLVNGEVIGSFGKMLDHAPTAEELNNEGE